MRTPRCASVQDSHDRNEGPLLDKPRNPFTRTRTPNLMQEWGVSLPRAHLGGKKVGGEEPCVLTSGGRSAKPQLRSLAALEIRGALNQHYPPHTT